MSSTEFSHRFNANGSVDSICLQCFRTVATANTESALRSTEHEHICDPLSLVQFYYDDIVAVQKRQPSKS